MWISRAKLLEMEKRIARLERARPHVYVHDHGFITDVETYHSNLVLVSQVLKAIMDHLGLNLSYVRPACEKWEAVKREETKDPQTA